MRSPVVSSTRITAKRFSTSRITRSVMSTLRPCSSARIRRPLSSVPVTPTYFAFNPRLAHAHIAVAIWPPQRMRRSRIRILAAGPYGCGKTTLLRLLAGLEALDSGAIWIGDRRVDALDAARRDVAMVFQNYALYPHLTVFDNIAFPLRTRRVPPAEIDRRVREAAG